MTHDPNHDLSARDCDMMSDRDWSIRASNRAIRASAEVGSLRSRVIELEDEVRDLRQALIALLDRMA